MAGALTIAYEGFNYPPGELFGGTPTTASGFSGTWMRFIPGAPDRASIVSGSLAYPGVSTSANRFENVHNRLTTNLNNSIAGPFALYRDPLGNIGADGTTLYMSVLLRQHADPQVPNPNPVIVYDAFELWRGDANSDANRKVGIDLWAGHPGGAANWFATSWAPTNSVTSSAQLIPTDTAVHLFVLKMTFGLGNNDSVAVYADPSLAGEPGVATGTISATDLSFDRVGTSIFSGQDNAFTADEIRFGTSYADVVPEPSSLALCVAGGMTLLRRKLRPKKGPGTPMHPVADLNARS